MEQSKTKLCVSKIEGRCIELMIVVHVDILVGGEDEKLDMV